MRYLFTEYGLYGACCKVVPREELVPYRTGNSFLPECQSGVSIMKDLCPGKSWTRRKKACSSKYLGTSIWHRIPMLLRGSEAPRGRHCR